MTMTNEEAVFAKKCIDALEPPVLRDDEFDALLKEARRSRPLLDSCPSSIAEKSMLTSVDALRQVFLWSQTSQGRSYWADILHRLQEEAHSHGV